MISSHIDIHKFFIITLLIICSLFNCKLLSISSADSANAYINNKKQLVISQHGITWTFDKQYSYGTYITGDYWVKGPASIISITPPSVKTGRHYLNGSMINPAPADFRRGRQGFTSQTLRYVKKLNVARPGNKKLSKNNPLRIKPGSSLCSSVSRATGRRPKIDTIAILTIVRSVPPKKSFRPPFTGTDKKARYSITQVDFSVVYKKLEKVKYTPSLKKVTGYFQKPWVDLAPEHAMGKIAAYRNMPWYGREYAIRTSEAALMLCLNFSKQEKTPLMIHYVQLGIDLYGAFKQGMRWRSNGGWMQGRKLPILFAGLVLHDKKIISDIGSILPGGEKFQEDGQTFYVSQADIHRAHKRWRGARVPVTEYTTSDIGLPEWGIKHDHRPEYDNNSWDTDYRPLCGKPGIGTALAARILGVVKSWNWQPFFDYQDRFAQKSSHYSDRAWRRQGSLFTRYMWQKYRKQYGPVWKR